MTVKERTHFVGDLLALYEACLIDLGRSWPMWAFMYPKDTDAASKGEKTSWERR